MIVEIMVFVVPTLFVIVILAGWVKTAVLIVAVMGTVTVLKALVFVTSVKIILRVRTVSSAFLEHLATQPPLKGVHLVTAMVTVIQSRVGVT